MAHKILQVHQIKAEVVGQKVVALRVVPADPGLGPLNVRARRAAEGTGGVAERIHGRRDDGGAELGHRAPPLGEGRELGRVSAQQLQGGDNLRGSVYKGIAKHEHGVRRPLGGRGERRQLVVLCYKSFTDTFYRPSPLSWVIFGPMLVPCLPIFGEKGTAIGPKMILK